MICITYFRYVGICGSLFNMSHYVCACLNEKGQHRRLYLNVSSPRVEPLIGTKGLGGMALLDKVCH